MCSLISLLCFFQFCAMENGQELDAAGDWKVHSVGNGGAFSRYLKSSGGVRIWREGKNQNHHLPHSLLCHSVSCPLYKKSAI